MAKQTQTWQAGDLRNRCDFFTLDTHRNGKGESIGKSPSPFAQNVPCRKRELGGVETGGDGSGSPSAARETAYGRAEFDLRYRSDLKETMLLFCEGVQYDILNIRKVVHKKWITIEVQKHD